MKKKWRRYQGGGGYRRRKQTHPGGGWMSLVLFLARSVCAPETFLTYLLRLHNSQIVHCCHAAKT